MEKNVKMMANIYEVCKIILFINSPNVSPKSCLFGGKIVKKIFFFNFVAPQAQKILFPLRKKIDNFSKGVKKIVENVVVPLFWTKHVISCRTNVSFRFFLMFVSDRLSDFMLLLFFLTKPVDLLIQFHQKHVERNMIANACLFY